MGKLLIQGDWLDGFSSGRKAALLDWQHRRSVRDFKVLVNRLRARKWAKDHPERASARALRWYHRHKDQARAIQRANRAKKYRKSPPTFTCARCGATWSKAPWTKGPKPRFCGPSCYQAHRYEHDVSFRERAKASARAQHAKRRAA